MSLVVAAVESGGFFAAAESKVTWTDDPARTALIWSEPWRKLHIVRRDLFVGITGSSFFEASEHLVRAAQIGSAESVEFAALDLESCDIVIGSLGPLRLVRTREGERLNMTERGRTWAGDPEAYERFRQLESPVFGGPSDLGLQAPMQSLAGLHRTESVGGYVAMLITDNGGFRYRPTPLAILGGVEACVLVGWGATPGAMAIHIPHRRIGVLYCQASPWEPIALPAARCEDLVALAESAKGQSLQVRVPCSHVSITASDDRLPGE